MNGVVVVTGAARGIGRAVCERLRDEQETVVAVDIDAALRAALAADGWADYPHHTGHGLGFSWHEEPRIVPDSATVLEPGMIVALEPGAYGEHWGLRVEQVAVVTQTGHRVLSGHALALEQAAG